MLYYCGFKTWPVTEEYTNHRMLHLQSSHMIVTIGVLQDSTDVQSLTQLLHLMLLHKLVLCVCSLSVFSQIYVLMFTALI